MSEYYDLGDGIVYGVMGGDAIMNAHRREERKARREALMKEREQIQKGTRMTTKDIFIFFKDMIIDIIKTNNLIVSPEFISALEKFEEALDEGYSL